jgi:hypothetical protein
MTRLDGQRQCCDSASHAPPFVRICACVCLCVQWAGPMYWNATEVKSANATFELVGFPDVSPCAHTRLVSLRSLTHIWIAHPARPGLVGSRTSTYSTWLFVRCVNLNKPGGD